MKAPWRGVVRVNMKRKTVAAVSLGMTYIRKPNNQEQPTEAKMERYTLNSAEDFFCSDLDSERVS